MSTFKRLLSDILILLVVVMFLIDFSHASGKGKTSGKALGKAAPIRMTLNAKGKKVFLNLNRRVDMVKIYLKGKEVHSCGEVVKCQVPNKFAKLGGDLTFICTDGSYEEKKTLSVRKFKHLFVLAAKKPKAPSKNYKSVPAKPSSAPAVAPLTEQSPTRVMPNKSVSPRISLSSQDPSGVPFVSIDKIYLKDDIVWVKLKNTGKVRLSSADATKGILTLNLKTTRHTFRLRSLGLRKLSPGEIVELNTGIKMTKRSTIYASISHLDGDKNKPVLLAPPVLKPSLMTESKLKAADKSTSKIVKVKTETLKPTTKAMAKAPKKDAAWPRLMLKETIRPDKGIGEPKAIAKLQGATVKIHSLRLQRPGSINSMATTGGETSAGLSEYTVDAKERFTLSYRISGCKAREITTELRGYFPDGGQLYIYPTEDIRNEDDCIHIAGTSEEVEVTENLEFVLSARVVGLPGYGVKTVERTIRLNVNRPEFILETPEVNEAEKTVTLYLSNQSTIDYPGSCGEITGRVLVTNWNRHYTYANVPIYQYNLSVPAGGRVEIARISLTDYETLEHLYAAKKILIEATVDDECHFFDTSGSFVSYLHHWSTNTAELDAEILKGILTTLMSGEIRLHNYQAPGSNETSSQPGIASESWVDIGGERTVFTFPFFQFHVVGKASGKVRYDYRPFINDLSASFGDRSTISFPIRNSIHLDIDFETNGLEIIGYEYDDGTYIENEAPDFDITDLSLDVNFWLALRNGSIIIDRVTVVPMLSATAYDRFSNILNKLLPKVEDYARNELGGYIRSMVGMDSFEDRLNEEIKSALSLLNVEYINRFELNSDGLALYYVLKPS